MHHDRGVDFRRCDHLAGLRYRGADGVRPSLERSLWRILHVARAALAGAASNATAIAMAFMVLRIPNRCANVSEARIAGKACLGMSRRAPHPPPPFGSFPAGV